MIGITAFGAYVPRLRLSRKVVVEANAWAAPGLRAQGKGERAICNWDEDSLTMAVEAARDCLTGRDRAGTAAVSLASTSLPFEDRLNSGIVAQALNLGEDVETLDVTSSQRAGTSGLLSALRTLSSDRPGPVLFVAADNRRTKAGGVQELMFGDGAAALLLGTKDVVAAFKGAHSVAVDFVDHYRGQNRAFDYNWEERWIRDEGYMKIVPKAVKGALADAGVSAGEIAHFILPCTLSRVADSIAKRIGIAEGSVRENLHLTCGEAGTAHALLMLVHALQQAKPGDKILVASFGQGCDALVFEATDALSGLLPRLGVTGHLARRKEETNYAKFLAFNDLVTRDKGMRAELDNQTALTQLYRRREMLLGLVGGRCTICGTRQFPKTNVCVNPNCGAFRSQEDELFSESLARVLTWSADHLTYTMDPPAHYGMVQFEEGGRFLANFTDVDVGKVSVGMPMRMMFRIKDYDDIRGFRRYFWKAAPALDRRA
jgi:hydroxymethylglutaryl-CoA synthase